MILRTICAFLFGAALALSNLGDDQDVRTVITAYMTQVYEQSFNCRMAGECTHVNLLNLSFTIDDFSIAPVDHAEWSWGCAHYTTSFSLLHMLRNRVLGMFIKFENIHAHTGMHGTTLEIIPHLYALLSNMPAGLPFVLTGVSIPRLTVDAIDHATHHAITADCRCNIDFSTKTSDVQLEFFDGCAQLYARTLFEKLQGRCTYHVTYDEHAEPPSLAGDCIVRVPALPADNNICHITCMMHGNTGSCTCSTPERTTLNALVTYTSTPTGPLIDFHAQAPLASALNFANITPRAAIFSGSIEVHGTCEPNNTTHPLNCTCQLHDTQVNNYLICSHAQLDTQLGPDGMHIAGLFERPGYGYLEGTGIWSPHTATGSCELHNKTDITLPFAPDWRINAHQLSLAGTIDNHGTLQGTYTVQALHSKTSEFVDGAGTVTVDATQFVGDGSLGKKTFHIDGDFASNSKIKKLTYKNDDGVTLFDAHAYDNAGDKWRADIHADLLKKCVAQLSSYQIDGNGNIQIYAMKCTDGIHCKVEMKDGALRLLETYNVLRSLKAFATLSTNHATLHTLNAVVDEGTVSSKGATVHWHGTSLSFVYLPVVFNDCMLMLSKDFLSQVGGSLIYSLKQGQVARLEGHIILDRTMVKENIFSDALREQLAQLMHQTYLPTYDMQCQLEIVTRGPLRVKTSFLEAHVSANMLVAGSLQDPHITGRLDVTKGLLHFPYKPLYITKGTIRFIPYQLYDPAIELVAKGKIKKYNVTLRVGGSLQHHDMQLYTSPPLSEEQIVALLLIGSDEASLSSVAPALVTSNVATLIFGAARGTTSLERYFSTMLKPFKYVRFIPSFSDQSGRGGLRGGIEIEMADRWRALIQKNFSLSEDTRFELEYQLSDDISLKAIRDEHHDISGEVEMRWKF